MCIAGQGDLAVVIVVNNLLVRATFQWNTLGGRCECEPQVAEHLATEEISIGDFVLFGSELRAALVVDAVTRLAPRRSSAALRPCVNVVATLFPARLPKLRRGERV
jgi:hypothetical protein